MKANKIWTAEENKEERGKLYVAAWEHWGKDAQLLKTCEELAELIHAICRSDNGGILEEIADVEIMIEQIKNKMVTDDIKTIENWKEMKLERLWRRLQNETAHR